MTTRRTSMRNDPFPGDGGAYRVDGSRLVDETSKPKPEKAEKPTATAKAAAAESKGDTTHATAARRGTNQE